MRAGRPGRAVERRSYDGLAGIRGRPEWDAVDYAPHTADDVRHMLTVLGRPDVDALFDQVPHALRAPAELGLPDGLAEDEVQRRLAALAARNTPVDDATCFLGGGAYDHYVPALVPAVTGKPEFATAYTP